MHAEALSILEFFPMDSQQHQLQLGGNTGRSYWWKLVFCYHLIVSGSACLHCKSEKGPAALPSAGRGTLCWSFHPLCTPVFHWNSLLERKRKVAQYKPKHNISYAAPYALRHGRRQREPSLEQSVMEPAEHRGSPWHRQAVTHWFCHSRRGPGRRMRSHSSLFSRLCQSWLL